ncbi:hypothetical protein RHGRI_027913 [Rhododendron griersonianum]|uniref:Uncharacterized protein n=1 Tax=Rhododendron griersonianum TaxID=479676 RepID=A0AAV6J0D7_9ERIC|nr:hypothetical protein RHGRI_027913 [Rhododendron griersonianum]
MASSKSVYIRVKNFEHKEEFYSLAVNVPGEDDVFEIRRGRRGSIPILTPIKGASNIPMEGGFAAVNNTVYCIGGEPVKRPKVFGHHRSLPTLFSLDNTSRSWKRRPSMRTARSRPQTVAVDGKIYVISGADYGRDPATVWGEVFDTKSGKLGSLSPPSPLPEEYALFAVAVPDFNKFVLGSYECKFLYLFEAEESRWEPLDHNMAEKIPPNLQPVGVGTFLIWFRGCTLHAYDWSGRCSYMGSIRDLDKVLPHESLMELEDSQDYPPLLHLSGNLFCLICLEDLPFRQKISLLHCVTFHISQAENGMLKAAVKCSQAYVIQTPYSICGAVLLK